MHKKTEFHPAYASVFRPELFAGRTMVVTGAGSGIGRCTAHELAALGASLVLIGRNIEKLQSVEDELLQANPGIKLSKHSCDIRDEDAVETAMTAAFDIHGRFDGLVNNAGGQYPMPLEMISLKGWEAVIKTNLTGGFIMAKAVHALWMKSNGGAIVNIIADMWNGMPGMGHSGAARAGMLNFTETAACEWANSGIRVNAVAPGWIASSGLDTYEEAMKAQLRRLRDTVPLRRLGLEAEVSGAIVFLLSPVANFITGTCIRVDGGVPNARHTWPAQPSEPKDSTQAFDGFKLAQLPKMLDE
jgi:citronellol/citronellal dehydrogenase